MKVITPTHHELAIAKIIALVIAIEMDSKNAIIPTEGVNASGRIASGILKHEMPQLIIIELTINNITPISIIVYPPSILNQRRVHNETTGFTVIDITS